MTIKKAATVNKEAAIAELHSMLEDVAHDVLREGYLSKKTVSAEMTRFAKCMVRREKRDDQPKQ